MRTERVVKLLHRAIEQALANVKDPVKVAEDRCSVVVTVDGLSQRERSDALFEVGIPKGIRKITEDRGTFSVQPYLPKEIM